VVKSHKSYIEDSLFQIHSKDFHQIDDLTKHPKKLVQNNQNHQQDEIWLNWACLEKDHELLLELMHGEHQMLEIFQNLELEIDLNREWL